MFAKQLSKRGGDLWGKDLDRHVLISGTCAFYFKGEITV